MSKMISFVLIRVQSLFRFNSGWRLNGPSAFNFILSPDNWIVYRGKSLTTKCLTVSVNGLLPL